MYVLMPCYIRTPDPQGSNFMFIFQSGKGNISNSNARTFKQSFIVIRYVCYLDFFGWNFFQQFHPECRLHCCLHASQRNCQVQRTGQQSKIVSQPQKQGKRQKKLYVPSLKVTYSEVFRTYVTVACGGFPKIRLPPVIIHLTI